MSGTRSGRRAAAVAIGAIALIPLIYGGALIWANQDPTHRLDRIPAAVVDLDAPVKTDGTRLAVGDEVARRLVSDRSGSDFSWTETSAADAAAGLAQGRYEAVITLPADLSASAASLQDAAGAKAATIEVATDDGRNFLVGTIAKQIAQSVAQSAAKDVASGYLDRVYLGFDGISKSLAKAADGADTLATKAGDLASGAAKVASGASALASGAATVSDKSRQLASGAKALAAGAGDLADGTHRLGDGAAKLAGGAASLSDGVRDYTGGVDQLEAACDDLASVPDPYAAQLCAGIRQVAANSSDLRSAASAVATGASQTSSGAASAASGAEKLAGSTARLVSGAAQLHSGAQTLAGKTAQLATGARTAATGADRLASGAAKLGTQLDKGADDVPTYSAAERQKLADVAAQPVAASVTREHEVPSYGYGLTPYFLSLGLWVGGLAIYMIMRPLPLKLVERRAAAWWAAVAGYLRGAAIAVAQALLAVGVVTLGVGVHPANPAGLVGFAVLASLAFTAVNHALVTLFGPRGRFLGLILVVLQLAAAGATYPIETTPAFFQAIHAWLPITHAVEAVRSLIAGGSAGIATGCLALAAWLLGSLAVSIGVTVARRAARRPLLLPAFEL